MRTLFIGALAATVIGCSCPLRQQADLNSCLDVNEPFCFDATATREPIETQPVSFKTNSAPSEISPAIAAKTEKPTSAPASEGAHLDVEAAKQAKTAAKAEPPASRAPRAPGSLNVRPPASNGAADSNVTAAKIAYSHPGDDAAANAKIKAIEAQVESATAVAELLTRATAPTPDHAETQSNADAEETALAQPNKTSPLVYVLIARPEIESVSDLTAKTLAINAGHSGYDGNVRFAIAAAGAPGVQLSNSPTKAIDRVISGDVPAAVLTAVSPEAAEGFPDIAGFKIFRIPLSPRSH